MPVGSNGTYYKSMEDQWTTSSSEDDEEDKKRAEEARAMEAERRRATCGARQRLAFATAMLGSVEATASLGEQLPSDVLSIIGEVAASLGPPLLPVVHQQEYEQFGGGVWEARIGGLTARFPDKTREEIISAMHEVGGHGGKAAGILVGRPVPVEPGAGGGRGAAASTIGLSLTPIAGESPPQSRRSPVTRRREYPRSATERER
jgi:hypothetical protein